MRGVNLVLVGGNLGKDPESRQTKSGIPVTNLLLAVSQKTKDGEDKLDWINVRCFGTVAENCQKYLSKGDAVLVTGRLRSRTVDSNGYRQNVMEIVADRVQFLVSKKRDGVEDKSEEVPF